MWTDGVVFVAPVIDFSLGIFEADEPVKIQTFVPKASVEALDEGVVCRFSWP